MSIVVCSSCTRHVDTDVEYEDHGTCERCLDINQSRQDIRRASNKLEAIEAGLRPNNWQPVSPDAELANYQEAHDATLKVGEVAADLLYDLCTTVCGHVPVADADMPKRAVFSEAINDLLSDALCAAETASETLEREAA